jgi:hypothetical protein
VSNPWLSTQVLQANAFLSYIFMQGTEIWTCKSKKDLLPAIELAELSQIHPAKIVERRNKYSSMHN